MTTALGMVKPFIMGSDSAKDYLQLGIKILREKGTALDSVEIYCIDIDSEKVETSRGT